jgi:hypothetical protein
VFALVIGAVALTVVAACGGGSNPPAAAAGAPATSKAAPGNQPPPGAFGTAAAVAATSLEVQNPQTGQVTVNFNGSTTFTNQVSATLADVTVGSCVAATSPTGTPGSTPATLTARSVSITQAGANGCFAGNGNNNNGGAQRTPNPNRPRPSGTNGAPAAGSRAIGSVTAVTATGFTVQRPARGTNPAATTTVTVDATTTYTKTVSAASSALAVGDCVAAVGPSDDTGAITAKTISISKPGPNGCAGRGVFRGAGGGNG